MSETEVNIPLLRKAVEWAEAEAAKPLELREWEQRYYFIPRCDGDANVDTSDPVVDNAAWWRYERSKRSDECGTCFCVAGYVAHVSQATPVRYHHVSDVAASELGLTSGQASRLFDANNSIEDVRRIAESIAGERL